MKVKHTQSHDFDTGYVNELICKNRLSKTDAVRILGNANNVIAGLRARINAISGAIDGADRLAKLQSVFEKGKK